ncbi:hypothetical protein C1708_11780 [Streptomyces sp. DH-12]|nr:hypothetical protein C1708_11780 [Streptomyces sp. DH-12]
MEWRVARGRRAPGDRPPIVAARVRAAPGRPAHPPLPARRCCSPPTPRSALSATRPLRDSPKGIRASPSAPSPPCAPLRAPDPASAPARHACRTGPAAEAIWPFSQVAPVAGRGRPYAADRTCRPRRTAHPPPCAPFALAGCVPVREKAYSLSEGKA